MFVKGRSGNPGGRCKAAGEMARMIREETKGGRELVTYALQVYRDPSSTEANRRWAHDWLSDRGFGRALQAVDLQVVSDMSIDDEGIDYTKLTAAELDEIIADAKGDEPPALDPVGDDERAED